MAHILLVEDTMTQALYMQHTLEKREIESLLLAPEQKPWKHWQTKPQIMF